MDLKKKIIFSLLRQHKRNQAQIHELNYLFWECTLRCNLNCVHCGSDCTKESAIPDMPLPDFLKVLDSITPHINPNKTIIVITGGEPLMRKDLEQCGMEFYRRGFPWGIVTNGYSLTAGCFEKLLQAGLRSITVSFDGLEQNHDWFRGKKSSWKHALEAIKMVASTENLVYDVVSCVNKKNIDELDQIKKILIGANVKAWRLFHVFPKGRAENNPDLKLSNNEFRQMMDFIKQTRKEGLIKASFGCEGFLGDYELEVRDNPFFCQAGIKIGSVLIDGSISACPSLRADYIQGNIYTDDFWTVWNERYQIMRERSWTKTGKCAQCKSYKYCEGNGLHLRDEKTGELLCCHLEKLQP
ncbi:radical SAM protein [Paludibacter sp. 221]|uniref:TIGR04133 family radical SAM/SPASM protein n=1 Tax=Paludibacter sp. 221 TaxID=2302939 RepID=UPI0013D78EE4|nr:TIGR04133 family radical SAM/SPASM protein [Paludibacter sp. 221]NDV45926.1 radical SAM protein [Paludibacter sp. 221]